MRHMYIGKFEEEVDAAKAVNNKCEELKEPHKNYGIGSLEKRIYDAYVENSSVSIYDSVKYSHFHNVWKAEIIHKEISFIIGDFTDEKTAGKAVNNACRELNIEIKNKNIGFLEKKDYKKYSLEKC